jgi:AcrR family transcriptional regulator
MARQRISLDEVTEVALLVVDRDTLDALSLASVAAGLGVRPSALYTYVDGLDALRYAVAVASTFQLTNTIRDAALGQAGDQAIAALAHAYRGFAIEYPGRYASTLLPPARRDDTLAKASNGLLDVFARVIATGYGSTGDNTVHAARATRSAIHGFVALEAGQGFDDPTDRDASFDHLVAVIIAGLR